ncbi:hypothetical protein [Riemerella anatipestifer]|uniref:T9SS C-terminal target domain-containing protein n=2 Tax=Riemerella anatipestifer TaxID=34085 RepID=A0AAP3AL27_RIEAN|nr:hypothetical protein [Riemerella anatipestifer]AZZ58237.1 hypothetical protein AWB57_03840 [Riemerella anatipestifer]MBT0550502.1 hypothetical protein [Riemerella anatipestifer]MBT0553388.1 hypothetical protein [Riemerella anatipestifer]MBT0574003.1 hypothetical protein [Riemerella anatipestifer]MCE3023387.1 hypothetical protein [Riemerella anatipestifer]
MKKTTKLSVGVFLGLSLIAYGQTDGKVGINTSSPNATLEIKPNTTNLLGATNEGIIVPKLSKTRVAKMPSPQEGTLVYVVDDANAEDGGGTIASYTGTDARVTDITEKGYYFYNGTKWVRPAIATETKSFTRNYREDDNPIPTIKDDDYFVYLTNPSSLTLPTPTTDNKGRMLCFFSPENDVSISPQPIGQQQSLTAGYSSCYISTGTKWLNTTGL